MHNDFNANFFVSIYCLHFLQNKVKFYSADAVIQKHWRQHHIYHLTLLDHKTIMLYHYSVILLTDVYCDGTTAKERTLLRPSNKPKRGPATKCQLNVIMMCFITCLNSTIFISTVSMKLYPLCFLYPFWVSMIQSL